MHDIAAFKDEVAGYLRGSGHFAGVRVMTAYPAEGRDYPLPGPVVAVGVDQVGVGPAGFGGYWGESDTGSLLGSGATITLRFHLYAPPTPDGARPHALYEALCDCLLLEDTPFGCLRLTCGEESYDRTAAAWHLTARLTVNTALIRRETGHAIEDFRLSRITEKE